MCFVLCVAFSVKFSPNIEIWMWFKFPRGEEFFPDLATLIEQQSRLRPPPYSGVCSNCLPNKTILSQTKRFDVDVSPVQSVVFSDWPECYCTCLFVSPFSVCRSLSTYYQLPPFDQITKETNVSNFVFSNQCKLSPSLGI